MVSILILPFLAIPFAVGSRRSQRGMRTVFALALIVIYNEVIQQGANIAGNGTASHWLTLWMPCALLAVFAGWRYIAVCFTVSGDPLGNAIDRTGELLTGLRTRVMRRFRRGHPA